MVDSLQDGHIYLVEEERLDQALDIFMMRAEEKEGRGLMIARQPLETMDLPEEFSSFPQYRLGQGYNNPTVISPHRIPELSQLILNFCDFRRPGVILFEGIEYLMTQNNFVTVLNLLQYISDHLSNSRCSMIISINPLAFQLKHLHLLKREAQRLPESILEHVEERQIVRVKASKV